MTSGAIRGCGMALPADIWSASAAGAAAVTAAAQTTRHNARRLIDAPENTSKIIVWADHERLRIRTYPKGVARRRCSGYFTLVSRAA